MKIKLNEDYRITASTLNFQLEKRNKAYTNKQGKEIEEKWVIDGYYSNIKHLLYAYLKKTMLRSESISLNELINTIEETKKEISKIEMDRDLLIKKKEDKEDK